MIAEHGPLTRLSALEATTFLADDQGIPWNWAAHVCEIARQFGEKAEPVASGYVTVTWSKAQGYTIQLPGSKKVFSATLAKAPATRYSQSKNVRQPKLKEQAMPGKTGGATATEPEEAEKDYTVYANKEPTATMVDFATWLKDVTGIEFKTPAAEAAFDKGVALGGTLRMEFQRSDYNKEQRAERAAARAEANGAAEEPAEETPKPARRGRPAKSASTDETPKPAASRRGRGRGAAAASAEAPF